MKWRNQRELFVLLSYAIVFMISVVFGVKAIRHTDEEIWRLEMLISGVFGIWSEMILHWKDRS